MKDNAEQMAMPYRMRKLARAPRLERPTVNFIRADPLLPDSCRYFAQTVAHGDKVLTPQRPESPHGGATAPPAWNKPSSRVSQISKCRACAGLLRCIWSASLACLS